MITFCLSVGLIGVVAGLSINFLAASFVFALAVVIAGVCYVWQGIPFQNGILPVCLCLLFMQIGYAMGLVLSAVAGRRQRVVSGSMAPKPMSREEPH